MLELGRKADVKIVKLKIQGDKLEKKLTKNDDFKKGDVDEFQKGRVGINNDAAAAREKMKAELEKINPQIEAAIKTGDFKKEKEFRAERDKLFEGEKYEEWGGETTTKEKKMPEKIGDSKTDGRGTMKNESDEDAIDAKVNEEIKKLLGDPTSELSKLLGAVRFREEYIEKLTQDLEKAKSSKIDTEKRVKFYEKSIGEHKATLEKFRKKMREITEDIRKKIISQKNN